MSQRRFFYGWIIVAVSFINLAVALGTWYSFSVFFIAVIKEFGWSRAATAGIFSCFMIVHALATFMIGAHIDRFGPRLVFPVAACIAAAGLLMTSRIQSLWEFYLWYGVLTPIGICAVGFIGHGIILPKWFDAKRGLAIGIAMAGSGFGMQLLVPGIQLVISESGWRWAYCILAFVFLTLLVPLNAFLQRKEPGEVGQVPDGTALAERIRVGDRAFGERDPLRTEPLAYTLEEALKNKAFWLLAAGFLFTPIAIQGTFIHQVAYVVDKGFDAAWGAFMFGLVGIMGSVGKILFGHLSDRLRRSEAFALGSGCALLGVWSLLLLEPERGWVLYAFVILFGLGYGSGVAIMPALSADLFLGPHFGKIVAVLYVAGGIGGGFGAWISGVIFDMTASYFASFVISMIAIVLASLFFWRAESQK